MIIPGYMLTTEIAVEPYAGDTGAGGPAYGASVTVRAHVEPRRILERAGREGTGSRAAVVAMFALVPPGTVIPVESRVTYLGRVYRVSEVVEQPGPGGGVHHLEVMLR